MNDRNQYERIFKRSESVFEKAVYKRKPEKRSTPVSGGLLRMSVYKLHLLHHLLFPEVCCLPLTIIMARYMTTQ